MSKKILIAEDELEILKMFTDMLEMSGYKVLPAHDGEEALQILSSHTPDLVLLDIEMPKRGGFDVLRALQATGSLEYLKVIVISNLDDAKMVKQAKDLGAFDYWLKVDTHLTDLVERVKKILKD